MARHIENKKLRNFFKNLKKICNKTYIFYDLYKRGKFSSIENEITKLFLPDAKTIASVVN